MFNKTCKMESCSSEATHGDYCSKHAMMKLLVRKPAISDEKPVKPKPVFTDVEDAIYDTDTSINTDNWMDAFNKLTKKWFNKKI